MDINEHKQEENQKTNIALFVLIASIVWFALGLGLVFASFNGSEAFGTATFFFFTSLLSIPCYGFTAWANVRQQSCRLLRIFRDCMICYVALSVGLFILAIIILPPTLGDFLLIPSFLIIALIIATNLWGYITIFYLQQKLAFTLCIIAQSIAIFSAFTFSFLASEIAAAC